MFTIRKYLLGLAALAAATATAAAQAAPMDRQKETALALSSCPASLVDGAAVYVLDKTGYVKVRDSQNGFTAIVQHAAPTSQDPQCMDAEGTRTFLPRMMKVAELRAQGKSQEEIQALVSDAITKGAIPVPSRPGVIYMLSGQNIQPNGKGVFPPHVMFYGTHLANVDLGVDGADKGPDGNPKGPVFVAGEGSPYALIIVPVASHAGPDHVAAPKPASGRQ